MKFSSEDLMKAMGLQVGDRVKTVDGIFELFNDNDRLLHWKAIESNLNKTFFNNLTFEYIYDTEYEILPRPKRVGELTCKLNCEECPLILPCTFISDVHSSKKGKTYFEILDKCTPIKSDQEIYDLLKARLDKEVE